MEPLFSEAGRQRLEQVVHEHMLCAFDFDGTLAPIVPKPDQAYLPEPVRQRLQELVRHAPVAILTGRSLQDIRMRIGFEPHHVLGNHGIEGLPGWEARSRQYRELCSRWERMLTAVFRENAQFDQGIEIENKTYSLSVHYRHTRDPERSERQLAQLFATLLPEARVVDGKFLYNLLPAGAEDKGSAIKKLLKMTGARSAIYVGDDVTDEDVFRLHHPDILSVRVETSQDSEAEWYLAEHDDIILLLDDLISRLRQARMKAIA